jgi:hypothetical protein
MELVHNGHRYQIARLNAFDQLQVARRLSTALIPLANLRAAADEKPDDEALARAFVTLTAPLPDDMLTPAIRALLGTIQRDLGGGRGWAPIATPQGVLMYDDLDGLDDLNVLLVKALDANKIIDFFVDRPSTSPGEAATATKANG